EQCNESGQRQQQSKRHPDWIELAPDQREKDLELFADDRGRKLEEALVLPARDVPPDSFKRTRIAPVEQRLCASRKWQVKINRQPREGKQGRPQEPLA